MPPVSLNLALYCEGNSDIFFLPILIRRTVEEIVSGHERFALDVQDVAVMNNWNGLSAPTGEYTERVLEVARRAAGFDILILHNDADKRTRDEALRTHYDPACSCIAATPEKVCKELVPLIPVRSIEAWIMADKDAIQSFLPARQRLSELGLPAKAHEVEAEREPKQKVNSIITILRGGRRSRRRDTEVQQFYEDIALQIDLTVLRQVSSFRQFYADLQQKLVDLQRIDS